MEPHKVVWYATKVFIVVKNFSYINLLIFVIKKCLKKMWWKEPTIKTHFEVLKGDILHITQHMFDKKYFQTLKRQHF